MDKRPSQVSFYLAISCLTLSICVFVAVVESSTRSGIRQRTENRKPFRTTLLRNSKTSAANPTNTP